MGVGCDYLFLQAVWGERNDMADREEGGNCGEVNEYVVAIRREIEQRVLQRNASI
jgi:hypothetical protein